MVVIDFFIYFYICVKVSVFISQQGRMNFDIFIRVIDWFVSICETTWQEAMINGREKGGKRDYFDWKPAYHHFG